MGGKTRPSHRNRKGVESEHCEIQTRPVKRKSRGGGEKGRDSHGNTSTREGGEKEGHVLDAVDRLYTDAQGTASILAAVESLYADGLKPYGRILRKRLGERSASRGSTASKSLSAEFENLRQRCEASPWLEVTDEEGGDWSAVLVGITQHFVDVYCTWDPYSPDLWASVTAYFMSLAEPDAVLPGGRYACASALVSRKLLFFQGLSLGQVCHIVQLSISQRKLLGYLSGSIVPYARSQSMIKDCCAWRQAPCDAAAGEAGVAGKQQEDSQQKGPSSDPKAEQRPVATWETARACLREIIDDAVSKGAGSVPLSNIKRFFRSRCQLELSETALGHPKLSELLQDPRMKDICEVRLRGQGYTVFPPAPGAKEPAIPQLQLLDCTWNDVVEHRQEIVNMENTHMATNWAVDSGFPAWTNYMAFCDGLESDVTGFCSEPCPLQSYCHGGPWVYDSGVTQENATVLPVSMGWSSAPQLAVSIDAISNCTAWNTSIHTGEPVAPAAQRSKSLPREVPGSSESFVAEESGSDMGEITTACLTDEPSSRDSMLGEEDACSEAISGESPYVDRASHCDDPELFALPPSVLPEQTTNVWRVRNTFIDCGTAPYVEASQKRSQSVPRSFGEGLGARRGIKFLSLDILRLPKDADKEASSQQDEPASPALTASPRWGEERTYWSTPRHSNASQMPILQLSKLL